MPRAQVPVSHRTAAMKVMSDERGRPTGGTSGVERPIRECRGHLLIGMSCARPEPNQASLVASATEAGGLHEAPLLAN